ncbi:hypothetical protein [Clostridium omnivorum]|uniref:Uncharacterized protein n=1 Tax=Clostridium omnivorum TaxID=1604902 RepID=A0ABQ5N7D8_9CLOT|nr:hypothetical protein [Clostridium sp. E14]GLC31173.1 hypothetical protein bsdE14_25830 [Clostridium sp. E14]
MSKEIIEIHIYYGQEEFEKLFEELIKATIGSQELPYKSIKEKCYNDDITQSPSTKV